ncbi:MAG: DUF1343 domain-containing protein [Chlamydiales bacterium]|nr:DUF1343 domain-containing protein [Chlamydiia bacterium]MCP5508506.1 DUF1343 domain-containing protein [Chlamydiales bacterium]
MYRLPIVLLILLFSTLAAEPKVKVGIDILMDRDHIHLLQGKKIGLVTNHTAVNSRMHSTLELLRDGAEKGQYKLAALFAPEHGINGNAYANEHIDDTTDIKGIPVYSLHGSTRRPTPEMLKGIDLIIYDIQDLGSRSYTYSTTLFYTMEAATKQGIAVMVLDRPNPINGITIDGPMLKENLRSMVGYINVPYCHGMTIGELARLFNGEYRIGCNLTVVPMRGWERGMSFQDTGLAWIPTSPQIPEASTAYYYPTTGILGELSLVNIGVGYTLPFKVVGAPWIDAKTFVKTLNSQKFPGVHFEPFHYRPFYGKFAQEDCQGALIVITDQKKFLPVTTQYLILGILKSLYPDRFNDAVAASQSRKKMFDKVNGTEEIYQLMTQNRHIVWPLRAFQQKEREQFRHLRQQYLLY